MTTFVQARQDLRKHALNIVHTSKVAQTVNGFESATAARHNGIHAVVVLGRGRIADDHSGLDKSSWRQLVTVRLESKLPDGGGEAAKRMLEDRLATRTATLIQAFHADIGVSDTIEFDPLGGAGLVLETTEGYLKREATWLRFEDSVLPFILYDVFDQNR